MSTRRPDPQEQQLLEAWQLRERLIAFQGNEAVRVFHGPGEGSGELAGIAIERFGAHAWVTEWEGKGREASQATRKAVAHFLVGRGLKSGVWLGRPRQGVPAVPEPFFGEVPDQEFTVSEEGLKFGIRLREVRHPGLFLDHLPLRRWLRTALRGQRVLNTFAYTGSLSVAAGAAGAASVTTLDLSKPTVRWAESNWALNGFQGVESRFIFGDVFEWLPRLKREGQQYDCVISDPPSFSRGNKGSFSTAKDLGKLHELLFDVLAPGGILVSSINSAQVPYEKMEAQIVGAARAKSLELQVLSRIDLPPTFPTRAGDPEARYLKGLVARGR